MKTILDYAHTIIDPSAGSLTGTIIIQAKQYPAFFLSRLFAASSAIPVRFLDVNELGVQSVSSHLSSLFLGQAQRFWLGSLDDLDARTKKELISTLAAYEGPNCVIAFASELPQELKHRTIITIPDRMGDACIELFLLIGGMTVSASLRKNLEQVVRMTDVSFDATFQLCYSVTFAGGDAMRSVGALLEATGNTSLFHLSTAFFARDVAGFLKQWKQVRQLYQALFWCSYWSEQLFRATWYVHFMREQKTGEAKQIAIRLPFSFTRTHWRRHSVQQLTDAHAALTQLDHDLKNGTDGGALDSLLLGLVRMTSGAAGKKA